MPVLCSIWRNTDRCRNIDTDYVRADTQTKTYGELNTDTEKKIDTETKTETVTSIGLYN